MWPEIISAKAENKRELNLNGENLTKLLEANDNKLDAGLFELTQLNFLQLTHSTSFCEIPDEVRKLENLQSLLLFKNQLASVPGEFNHIIIASWDIDWV